MKKKLNAKQTTLKKHDYNQRGRKRKSKPRISHPYIIDFFIEHIRQGWSPSTFSAKIRGGTHGLVELKRTNPEFLEIYEQAIRGEPI